MVLVINKLSFVRDFIQDKDSYVPGNTISTPGGKITTPGHYSSGSTEFLGSSSEFMIYDYNENDVITYGVTGVQTNFLFAMTRSTWETNFWDIAGEIFRYIPFKWTNSRSHILKSLEW